jgi:hypothetical protein
MLALLPPASIKDKSPPTLSRLMLPTGIFPAASSLGSPSCGSGPDEPPWIEDRGRAPNHWYTSSELLKGNKQGLDHLKAGTQKQQHKGQGAEASQEKETSTLDSPTCVLSVQDSSKAVNNEDFVGPQTE